MKALSYQQPWAWLIVSGYKDIENRSWELPSDMIGQRIYVHAGLRLDREAFEHDATYNSLTSAIGGRIGIDGRWEWMEFSRRLASNTSRIVGEVTITGCVTESGSPWFVGPYGFVFTDPVAYKAPIPARGHRGFWLPVAAEK